MKISNFNCVEMKHRGADKIKEKTSQMTKDQELKFWQEQSQNLKKHQKLIREKVKMG